MKRHCLNLRDHTVCPNHCPSIRRALALVCPLSVSGGADSWPQRRRNAASICLNSTAKCMCMYGVPQHIFLFQTD